MLILVVGLVLFFAIHLVPTAPELRKELAGRFGEGAYKAGFSAVALLGFVLIVVGYHKLQVMPGKNPVLWSPPAGLRHAALLLMVPVFPLLIASQLPGRLKQWIPNPMLLAVKLWALAHFLVRGDAGSLLLFGSFLAFAVYDLVSVKKRQAAGLVKVRTGPVVNDVIAVVGGFVVLYLFVRWGHAMLIGPALMP